jgi:hypothetical protein
MCRRPEPKSGGQAPLSRKRKSISRPSVRFNGQDPVSRSGKTTGRGAFEMQSAQAISAAYYFDLASRDYILADGAIELLIEGVPCSAFIEPSQSCELIFCARSDRLRGEKTCCRWWQIPSRFARSEQARDEGRERQLPRFSFHSHQVVSVAGDGCLKVSCGCATVASSFSGAARPIHPGSFDEANVTPGGFDG